MSAAVETHAEHGHSAAEPDNPKLVIIGPVFIVTIIFVVALIAGVVEFYSFAVRDQIKSAELEPQNSLLRELRAKEKQQLNEYRYVDRAKGVVRVPVDRAVALTLRDWDKRPGGTKPIAAPPAPAPVPAGTPGVAAPAAPAPAVPSPAAPKQGQK